MLAGGAGLGAAAFLRPRMVRAATKAMTVVLESEVTILDPHVITATITRTFGLHVFDMLFAMNEQGEIKPQMVESYDSSPDKLVYDPSHPDADPQGYVHMPNIEVVKEMVDMMAASRAYEANVTAISESRTIDTATMGILRA